MKIKVSLFAEARHLAGKPEIDLELPDHATVAVLKKHLSDANSQWARLIFRSMIAIDQQYAQPETILDSNSEIALIPPLSGG